MRCYLIFISTTRCFIYLGARAHTHGDLKWAAHTFKSLNAYTFFWTCVRMYARVRVGVYCWNNNYSPKARLPRDHRLIVVGLQGRSVTLDYWMKRRHTFHINYFLLVVWQAVNTHTKNFLSSWKRFVAIVIDVYKRQTQYSVYCTSLIRVTPNNPLSSSSVRMSQEA